MPGNVYAVLGAPAPFAAWTTEPGADALLATSPLLSITLPVLLGSSRFFRVTVLTPR